MPSDLIVASTSKIAERLGVNRSTVYRWVRRANLCQAQARTPGHRQRRRLRLAVHPPSVQEVDRSAIALVDVPNHSLLIRRHFNSLGIRDYRSDAFRRAQVAEAEAIIRKSEQSFRLLTARILARDLGIEGTDTIRKALGAAKAAARRRGQQRATPNDLEETMEMSFARGPGVESDVSKYPPSMRYPTAKVMDGKIHVMPAPGHPIPVIPAEAVEEVEDTIKVRRAYHRYRRKKGQRKVPPLRLIAKEFGFSRDTLLRRMNREPAFRRRLTRALDGLLAYRLVTVDGRVAPAEHDQLCDRWCHYLGWPPDWTRIHIRDRDFYFLAEQAGLLCFDARHLRREDLIAALALFAPCEVHLFEESVDHPEGVNLLNHLIIEEIKFRYIDLPL